MFCKNCTRRKINVTFFVVSIFENTFGTRKNNFDTSLIDVLIQDSVRLHEIQEVTRDVLV